MRTLGMISTLPAFLWLSDQGIEAIPSQDVASRARVDVRLSGGLLCGANRVPNILSAALEIGE
jgi:hypothetical protein